MTSANGSAYAIHIAGTGFHLWRERGRGAIAATALGSTDPGWPQATAGVDGRFGTGDTSQQLEARDVPRLYDDFSGGGGYSRRVPAVPNGYAWCIGDARWPRGFLPAGELIAIPLPTVPGGPSVPSIPLDSFEIGDHTLMVLSGREGYVVPRNGAAAGLGAIFDANSSATSAVRYGQYSYIAIAGGSPGRMWRFDHVTTAATQSSSVIRSWLTSVYWVVGGVGHQRIIGIDQHDRLRIWPAFPAEPGDPMNEDDWSAPYEVGNTGAITTHLVSSPDHVYVVKQDGIYDIDGRGYAPNLTPWWRGAYDPVNGLTACVHGQYVYASTAQGLDRIALGTGPGRGAADWCQPGIGLPNETPIFGRVRAVAPVFDEIAAAVYNGTDSYICLGRPRDQPGVQGGPGPVLWHMALARIDRVVVTYMKVHSFGTGFATAPWLLIGGVSAVDGVTPLLFRLALPKASSPYQAFTQPELYGVWGGFRFAATAQITLPTDDWGDAAAVKVLRRFDLRADNLGEASVAEVWARADAERFVFQDASTTSPRDTLFPTDELTTGYDITTMVALRGGPTVPPVLRALKLRAEVNVEVTEQRVYQILLAQYAEGANRARDRRDPGALWAQLWGLQAEGPVPMRDEHGQELSVKVEPGISSRERELPGGTGWALVATVTVSVLSRPAYWDVGIWNTDATYVGPDADAAGAAAAMAPTAVGPAPALPDGRS